MMRKHLFIFTTYNEFDTKIKKTDGIYIMALVTKCEVDLNMQKKEIKERFLLSNSTKYSLKFEKILIDENFEHFFQVIR